MNMFADASDKRNAEQKNIVNENTETNEIKSLPVNKDKKMISAQVSISVYDKFTKINKKAGLKNNTVLNNLIWQYVDKHEGEI